MVFLRILVLEGPNCTAESQRDAEGAQRGDWGSYLGQDAAGDSVLEEGDVEVEDQATLEAGEPEIGQKLGLVDWEDLLDAFDLDDDRVLDHQVHSIATVDFEAFESDRQVHLDCARMSLPAQNVHQAGVVRRFKETRPECFVNLDGGADDGSCDRVIGEVLEDCLGIRVQSSSPLCATSASLCDSAVQ